MPLTRIYSTVVSPRITVRALCWCISATTSRRGVDENASRGIRHEVRVRGEVGADPGVAQGELHFHRGLFQAELERRFADGEELEFSQNHAHPARR